MKTVAGVFDNKFVADKAMVGLMYAGFTKDNISLIMSEGTKNVFFSSTDEEANQTAKGATTGAVIGGALGALIAGLTAVGSLATAGGVILISGPIVAALSGAGVGGMAGGLAGALIRSGLAANEASHYEDEIKHGKAVVVVHAESEEQAKRARQALQSSGAMLKAA